MNLNVLFCLCFVLLLKFTGINGIKATLQAIPNIVRKGGHTVLRCNYYDLQGAPLYVVKWYRGTREFYRYDPNDTPQKRIFQIPKIYVDSSYSNSTQVTIRKMDFSSSGKYSCEVSADGPPFPTAISTINVEVIDPPLQGPTISTERTHYIPGDELQVNCTAPPSRPALNLTLFINNEYMSGAKRIFYSTDDGFKRSELVVTEILSNSNFIKGRMIITCVAEQLPLYLETATMTFWFLQDPKPQRITSPGDSGSTFVSSSNAAMILIIVSLFFIKSVLLQDYGDFYSSFEDIIFQDSYEDEVSPDMKASLL